MHAETVASDLQSYIGAEAEPPRVSRFLVNEAMIRTWVEALEDDNPVYTDPQAALATGREDIICPPAMLSTWVMNGYRRYREVQRLRDQGLEDPTAYSRLLHDLDRSGFTSVVATDIVQEYHAELTPGIRVTCRYTIDNVSDRKRTALGEGYFLTLRKEYVDEQERPLATELFRLLRFAPARPKARPRPTGIPPIVRTLDNVFWFDAAAEGRLLIQRCADCGELRHPPGPACPVCRSFRWDAIESSGRGTLHSWTVVHHPQDSAFAYPLAVGLIDLEEGTRLVADFDEVPAEGLEVGVPVHIVFGEHAFGEILPYVRLGVPLQSEEAGPPLVATVSPPEAENPEGGMVLPTLRIPLDRTAIAAGAIASHDFEDVHHDPGRAQERGMRDVFLSINTTNGLVDRYLSDWAGPAMRLHAVMLRLGVPHFAGEVLEFTGTVYPELDGRRRVEVVGRNGGGVHVTATATVSGVPTEGVDGR